MNLYLSELINSVPPEFSFKERYKNSILLQYKDKEIYIDWFDNGQPYKIVYYEDGQLHRPSSEGPAIQFWYKNGQPWEIDYHENGSLHRPSNEGPSYQAWHSNGQPWEIAYYENSLRHRPASEGPARHVWEDDGSLVSKEYWENGKEIKGLTKTK